MTKADFGGSSGEPTHAVSPAQLRDDSAQARRAADEFLENATHTAADCAGNDRADALRGLVMKLTRGRADPQMLDSLLRTTIARNS